MLGLRSMKMTFKSKRNLMEKRFKRQGIERGRRVQMICRRMRNVKVGKMS